MTTTINFYNVGLNATNLPYNAAALANILQAGQIEDGGQVFALTLTALPFDQFFNITNETYQIVKSATYLKLTNTFTDDQNVQHIETRYAFIDKIQQLANGNYSVYYTVDNWTSFYINSALYNLKIDGFTERANVPLYRMGSPTQPQIFIDDVPLTGKSEDKGFKSIFKCDRTFLSGVTLPTGYTCAVYFFNQHKYKGNPVSSVDIGTVEDFDINNHIKRKFPRESRIAIMVYDANGENVAIEANTTGYTTIIPAHKYSITQPHDDTIDKVMYFNFVPTTDNVGQDTPIYNTSRNSLLISGDIAGVDSLQSGVLYDIVGWVTNPGTPLEQTHIYQALKIKKFCPCQKWTLPSTGYIKNYSNVAKRNTYDDFIKYSYYRAIDEFRTVKLKYLTTEIDLPAEMFSGYAEIYTGMSGDGETLTLKYLPKIPNKNFYENNNFASTGQNVNSNDLVFLSDFKSYKNAKISGTLGLGASLTGSLLSIIGGAMSGNAGGIVSGVTSGTTSIVNTFQRLDGLSAFKQNASAGDYSLTLIENDNTVPVIIEISEPFNKNSVSVIKFLEENGALIEMAFADYYTADYQMQAYNALKMRSCDVTGAPAEICDDIKNKLLLGVTLWTANDVGNKAVINYKKEN